MNWKFDFEIFLAKYILANYSLCHGFIFELRTTIRLIGQSDQNYRENPTFKLLGVWYQKNLR